MRTRLAFIAAGLVLAAAGAGNALFGASAATAQGTTEVSVNAQASTNAGQTDPLLEAAAGAETVARSSGLRAAIGDAWRTSWQKAWPFIRSMTLKFFGLFGQAWHAIFKTVENGNVNANVNGSVNANAAVNASQ